MPDYRAAELQKSEWAMLWSMFGATVHGKIIQILQDSGNTPTMAKELFPDTNQDTALMQINAALREKGVLLRLVRIGPRRDKNFSRKLRQLAFVRWITKKPSTRKPAP
jgi:hypothetical protein